LAQSRQRQTRTATIPATARSVESNDFEVRAAFGAALASVAPPGVESDRALSNILAITSSLEKVADSVEVDRDSRSGRAR
jgi:hypothetical protein